MKNLAMMLLTFSIAVPLFTASAGDALRVRELLVKWKDGPDSPAAITGNARIGATVKRNFNAIGWQLVELPQGLSDVSGLKAYQSLGTVLAVEPNSAIPVGHIPRPPESAVLSGEINDARDVVPRVPEIADDQHSLRVLSTESLDQVAALPVGVIPNDPLFKDQWYMKKIGATNAWATTTGSSNAVVAIFDFDVDSTHPDLAPNMWINPGETGLDANGNDKSANGIDDDGNGYVDDVHGITVVDEDSVPAGRVGYFHGTLVAGLIGAAGNDGLGMAGVNWSVKIMSIRVGYTDEETLTRDIRSFNAGRMLAGWEYLIKMKRSGVNVRVSSHSEGLVAYSSAVRDAILTAGEEGILTVVGADNNGVDHDVFSTYLNVQNLWPLIYVAASDQNDQLATWSDYGKSTVHLAAPGQDVMSTTKGGGYFTGSGTSLSCPLVSGAAALLLSKQPTLTVNELKAAILGSVDRPAALRNKTITGGRLNLARALQSLENTNPPAIVLTAIPAGPRTRAESTIQVTFSRSMNRLSVESAFQITPPVGGAFNWSGDNHSFSFVPASLFDKSTNYTVRILGSAQDQTGGTLDGNFNQIHEGSPADDFVWTFRFPVANDDFANAEILTGPSGTVRGTTRYTLAEDAEPILDNAYGLYSLASVWYRWTPPESGGWFTFELPPSISFDSYLAIYTGDDLGSLVTVAGNDNYFARKASRVSFFASSQTNYSIAVIDKGGFLAKQWGPFTLSWYPTPPPGFTGTQFSPTRGVPGAKVTLTGTNLTGATTILFNGVTASFTNALTNNFDLKITAVVPPDARSGSITVVSPHGNVTSTATFQVLPPPLHIVSATPSQIVVSWPSTSPEFILETSEQVQGAAWTPLSENPFVENGASRVSLVVEPRNQFLRLRKSSP